MSLTKQQFKQKWEGMDSDAITFEEVFTAAKEWGISENPENEPICSLQYKVLTAAKCKKDIEEYNPNI